MKKFLLLASLLTTSAMASPFSYTNIDLGYAAGSANLPDSVTDLGFDDDLDIDGFFVAGRYEITNNFFIYASYEDAKQEGDDLIFDDSFELDTWRVEAGLGGYVSFASCADFYYSVGYKYTETELDDFDDFIEDQNVGHIDLNIGVRWAPATWIEINPYFEYSIGVDDDEFIDAENTATIGLNVYVTAFQYVQPFAGIAYDFDSDDDHIASDLVLYSIGLRCSF